MRPPIGRWRFTFEHPLYLLGSEQYETGGDQNKCDARGRDCRNDSCRGFVFVSENCNSRNNARATRHIRPATCSRSDA